MNERLLTPEEAARQLLVSSKTFRRWLRSGRIPGMKAGRLWRVRESDLKRFREAYLERLLTPDEAAHKLAVSPKTLRHWLRTGRIHGEKAGRWWRIKENDLQRFLVVHDIAAEDSRARQIASVRGIFAGSSRTVDDFLSEKRLEVEQEERRNQ